MICHPASRRRRMVTRRFSRRRLASPPLRAAFTSADLQAMLDPSAPNTGVVLVEIFFNYDMILGLPWITAFIDNPVVLHAYTIMPNTFVEPTRTPGG
jgi:hypothetical protein